MSAVSPVRGVGGLAAHAVQADTTDPAADVQRWTRLLLLASASGGDAFSEHCAAFPFAAVVDHVRRFGKTAVSPWLPTTLEYAHRALHQCARGFGAGLDAGTPGGVLDRWLPLTFDLHRDAVSYDSYIGNPLLESVDGGTAAVDGLITALVADLAGHEARERSRTAGSGQQKRTRAALRALLRVREVAPYATNAVAAGTEADEPDSAVAAAVLAARTLEATPRSVAQVVTLTMLPMTALHDEVMFVRTVQILDRLFAVLAAAAREADKALAERDVRAAAALLDSAAGRVEGTAPLLRLLATMPAEVFAVLRMTTEGSSAIQSRSFRDFETTAAALDPALLPAADRDRIHRSMARLQGAWQAFKRTHWGIAVKLVGSAAGTGGTSGARYLRERVDRPLFPLLPGSAR
ncbi:hypothetical protein [Jidongwangia harbinensis]|uniref:hypothetical protein n=1 Tax=Jidongwangia harbinensis TaxID=2878561 RepID=UPI001CD9E870|nr:hypothetical protein [Jidongwangia harbinensis]MCA2211552.1 hypothetical protein [Jidongwangia harbinensis]